MLFPPEKLPWIPRNGVLLSLLWVPVSDSFLSSTVCCTQCMLKRLEATFSKNKFRGSRWSLSFLGCQLANQNLDNLRVLVNALLNQKHSTFHQLIPKHQANSPNKVDFVAAANQIFSIFLSVVLYSLSYKSFLPSAPFCCSLRLSTSRNVDICLYMLNCLL